MAPATKFYLVSAEALPEIFIKVAEAVEKFAVFNHTKKCFLCSGNFRRKTGIFCAAVVNKKGFSAVRKSHR